MILFFLFIWGISVQASASMAPIPPEVLPLSLSSIQSLILDCKSSTLGNLEIQITQPVFTDTLRVPFTHIKVRHQAPNRPDSGSINNEITADFNTVTYTHTNTLYSQATATVDSNRRSQLYPEPTLHLLVPAQGTNWGLHAKECYVRAPHSGIEFTIGISSQTIYSTYRKPEYLLFEDHPQLQLNWRGRYPYSLPYDTLHGENCAPPPETRKPVTDDLNCKVAI